MKMDSKTEANAKKWRGRWTLIAIASIFFGFMFLAFALRYAHDIRAGIAKVLVPSHTVNKGELLQPPTDLRAATPKRLDGSDYRWNPVERTWRIALAPPADCGAECARTARDLYTVWELLGREATRVDVLWLCAATPCALPGGAPVVPNLRLLQPDAALRARFPRVDAVTWQGGRGVPVYVIDPNGFVILRYAAGADPGDLRSDLAKLLKLK